MNFNMYCREHNLEFLTVKDFIFHMSKEHPNELDDLSNHEDNIDEVFSENLTKTFSISFLEKLKNIGEFSVSGKIHSDTNFYFTLHSKIAINNGSFFENDIEFISEGNDSILADYDFDGFIVKNLNEVIAFVEDLQKKLNEFSTISCDYGASDFKVSTFSDGYICFSFNFKGKEYSEFLTSENEEFHKLFLLLNGEKADFIANEHYDGFSEIYIGNFHHQNLFNLAKREGKKLKITAQFVD